MLNLLKKLTTKSTNVSEELSTWEIVDPSLTDTEDDVTKNEVETNGACLSRESGLVLDDVTHFVKAGGQEENEVGKKGELRLVSRNYEEEEDVDEEDDGEEEDLMHWKLKGRFGKQNKRGGTKLPTNKMPCYYHTRPKTVLERRGKRLVW